MILLHPVKPQKLRVKTSYISPKREIGYLLVTDGTRLFRGSRGTINHTVILYTLARCRVMNCIRSNSVGQYYAVVAQWRLKNNRNIIVPKRGNATPSLLSLSLSSSILALSPVSFHLGLHATEVKLNARCASKRQTQRRLGIGTHADTRFDMPTDTQDHCSNLNGIHTA